MPLITTRSNASARGYGAFLAAAASTAFESIATVSVGSGGQATAQFNSIPATYKHLQVRVSQKAASAGDLEFRFNASTGNDYTRHFLGGNGSSAFAGGSTSQANGYVGFNPSGTYFQGAIIDILDYADTNKYTSVRSLLGTDSNGSGAIYLTSTLYLQNTAITSIKFTHNAGNFSQYSHFALYGIKGAA